MRLEGKYGACSRSSIEQILKDIITVARPNSPATHKK